MDFTTKFGFPKPILNEQGSGKAQEFADAMDIADASLASHDHTVGAGSQISHTNLSDIGTNSHSLIDAHLSSTNNPHGVTANQVLPSQAGQGGNFLKTDGANVSWVTPPDGAGGTFNPSGLSADSYRGDIFSSTAGENLNQWDAVYLNSDGKWWKAKADATATCPAQGVAVAAANADESATLLFRGFFRDDDGVTLPVGGMIYLSPTTAGTITGDLPSTSGNQVQILGYALTAQIRVVNPNLMLIEVP